MKLTEEKWEAITNKIGGTFRLNSTELDSLRNNKIAKLIACIPFIAECIEPERTALTHLSTYMLAKDPACKEDFIHNLSDNKDILSRIQPLNTFRGGLQRIIDRGINLLALIQLEDHKFDLEKDKAEGKYNPVLEGIWSYKKSKQQLIAAINGVPCPDMDSVIPPSEIEGWWNAPSP